MRQWLCSTCPRLTCVTLKEVAGPSLSELSLGIKKIDNDGKGPNHSKLITGPMISHLLADTMTIGTYKNSTTQKWVSALNLSCGLGQSCVCYGSIST